MFLLDDTVVVSSSDITQAGQCEFAFLRRLDVKLGRAVEVPDLDDDMLARAARLGDEHEARQLRAYRAEYGGDRVIEIDRPEPFTREGIEKRAAETAAALADPTAQVIFQATFFDPALRVSTSAHEPSIGFIGFADFLHAHTDDSGNRVWQVQDTKLARSARVAALVQVAAYGEQIHRVGAAVHDQAVLILGDASRSEHRLADISPVYRSRRDRLCDLVTDAWSRDRVVAWAEAGVHACGRCEVCEPEVNRTRDPLLIAGMRLGQRAALLAAGINTIDALAMTPPGSSIAGMTPSVLDTLIDQAAVQVESERLGRPAVRVVRAAELGALPEPDEGDLFFDFEGDPMHREQRPGSGPVWGLDYLFGMVDAQEVFTPLWAHSIDDERQALIDFIALVSKRRETYPNLHIYHYASYERSHLLSIAARHGVCEREVDDLLRSQVLVDLYPVVRKALKIGSRSYSIKKLEPLYMGDELRDEDGVVSGAQSVTEYAEAVSDMASDDPQVRAEGHRRLEAIADYNRYDCVSTLRLRDWLLSVAAEHGVKPAPRSDSSEITETFEIELSDTAESLMDIAAQATDAAESQALRLAASAIDYHQREHKSFWWAHFARLTDPIEDWTDSRDVVTVDRARSWVVEDWHKPPRARKQRRTIEVRGHIAPGSSLKPDQSMFAVYEPPAPFPQRVARPGTRGYLRVTLADRFDGGVTVTETLPDDADEWTPLPVALTPGPPPHAGSQKGAIEAWGAQIVASYALGQTVRDPVFDLLQRIPPRFTGIDGPVAPGSDEARALFDRDEDADMIGAVVASLLKLDRSYLAVQGPPGTGKTYLASRVIRKLVETYGWRIGVVAQSHKVVENVLQGVVSAGLDPEYVGKVPQGGSLDPEAPTPPWTVLRANGHQRFLDNALRLGRGAVVGGTAWDFSNTQRFGRGELDLLVIDEAGQFSLAPTIAAAVSAQRLLLLGDPQQLPQVSQGSHPEPVDVSALGWLIDDHDTLPEYLGYFLDATRRMHPALADIDSRLSYEGRLHAHPTSAARIVHGATSPGLAWHPVTHVGNATHSPEEAARVVELVSTHLTASITEPDGQTRPFTEHDIIVVAAYNAQVECVTQTLRQAGYGGVRVGTVDRFQGQEAVIAVVTLAASSPADVPRGLEFLLMRNRLNVAISRAQWAAHLISSTALGGTGLPTSSAELTALSGYLFLTEAGSAGVR